MKTVKHRGVILIVVLVVSVLLSLSVLAFSRYMMAQRRGTDHSLRQKQVRLFAESGVEYLRVHLTKEPYVVLELGGLYDNPDEFRGRLVTDGSVSMTGYSAGETVGLQTESDRRDIGRFSVLAPLLSEDGLLTGDGYRYGLEDESCKLNLRWLLQVETQQPGTGRSMLLRLPGVTEEIADSILDWMDADSEPRDDGAEDDYYGSLDPPYYTRNGLPDSIDELLLVRGVTPKLLYGIDWNRNGVVDPGEPDESRLEEFDVADGSLNLGLAAYLTLDSRESTVTPDGLEKINVNMDDLDELRELLDERFDDATWVDYIISYRQRTATSSTGSADVASSLLSGAASGTAGGSGASSSGTKINSLLDLVRSTSSSAAGTASDAVSGTETTTLDSPFSDDPDEMNDYLPTLYDNLTVGDAPIVGRININQAPRTVLYLFANQDDELSASVSELGSQADVSNQLAASMGLGQATSFGETDVAEIIEGILAERIVDPALIEDNEMNYPFWPYTHGIITDFELMKRLEPYFCTQGAVFKANVVARFDEQSPVVRLEVWLDAAEFGRPAKVIRVRELSELGPGFSAEVLGADEYGRENP